MINYLTWHDTILRVPPVIAAVPRQHRVPTREEIEEAPSDDDVVVEDDVRCHDDSSDTDAFQGRTVGVRCDWSETRKLTKRQLHEEERQSNEQQHEDVRYEEGTCNTVTSALTCILI